MNTPALQQKCVLIRGNVEFWLEHERAKVLEAALAKPNLPHFIEINGQHVNTFEIIGVFTPDAIDERRRRANGQWTCKWGKWHEKGEKCKHAEAHDVPIVELKGDKAVLVGYTKSN